MRFEVEYNFIETKWGRSPMEIMWFNTREEAEKFAEQYEDAKVEEYEAGWRYTETGKKVRIF